MSLLSILGSIGKGALGLVPGGGTASTILGTIGNVASGAAKGSADQRIAETPGQVGAYNANLAGTQMQDRRSALASLLDGGGLQDAHISRPEGSTIPTFGISGGLRPSAMNQSALLAQLGKTIQPMEMPKAGMGEKILGGIGLGSSILGALGGIVKKPAGEYGNDLPSQGGIAGNLPRPNPALMDPRIYGQVRF